MTTHYENTNSHDALHYLGLLFEGIIISNS